MDDIAREPFNEFAQSTSRATDRDAGLRFLPMWPFGRRGVARSLAELEPDDPPTEVEVLVQVVSPNRVESPVTGVRAAILHVEVLEELSEEEAQYRAIRWKRGARASLGEVLFGDLVTCRDAEARELSFVARRARFRFSDAPRESSPLAAVPPELVPLLGNPRGGALTYREHVVREGDQLRVQTLVESTRNAVTLGYRSVPRLAFVARDDLAPVFLASPQ